MFLSCDYDFTKIDDISLIVIRFFFFQTNFLPKLNPVFMDVLDIFCHSLYTFLPFAYWYYTNFEVHPISLHLFIITSKSLVRFSVLCVILSAQNILVKSYLLREKCPSSELFWSAFFRIRTEYSYSYPYSVRMRENAGKIWTRINPNTNNFYAIFHETFLPVNGQNKSLR